MESQPKISTPGNKTILIVEDDDDVRLFAVEVLRALRDRVLHASMHGKPQIGYRRTGLTINRSLIHRRHISLGSSIVLVNRIDQSREPISIRRRRAAGAESRREERPRSSDFAWRFENIQSRCCDTKSM
jgi:hypothetical protein